MPGSFGEQDRKYAVGRDEHPTPPCYISSRSADVILSDVRPTTLSPEALNSINALLDELLRSILSVARALSTTRLRAALNKVLPTTLGKEAVLEAELELRAYWERTGGARSSSQVVDDSTFNLQWTFELLRLKCEAYSTLSDTDENPEAETRLFEHMNAEGIPPPKQSLLAPASLYLTAIIESICEHVVSNVGRVAARDSSRATANSQDLFVALCEDSSIYGPFRNMAVYGQIETLSKMPRSTRSMSISRENGAPTSPPIESFRRNGSINGSRRKMSFESLTSLPAAVANSTTQPSTPSFEKSRGAKMFNPGVSQDVTNGTEPGHRKTDSFASANTKQSVLSRSDRSPISPTFSEDTRSQEFDDMMKSGSTMKVSLTPDRLRTMEVLNKEKARANGRQKTVAKPEKSNSTDIPASIPSHDHATRGGKPTSTVRRVGSTIANEEERVTQRPPPTSRPRQLSAATASGYTVPSLARIRASSTSDPSTVPPTMFAPNKSSFSETNPPPSDQSSASGSTPRRKAPPQELDINASRAPRTRTVARNRESLDLDDVMGDSGDEDSGGLKPPGPSKRSRQRGLSASARELIDFLAEGPPEITPDENSLSPPVKKSGRLQKMLSKITLNGGNDSTKSPRKATMGSSDAPSKSMTNLSPLANRPIPPRYPTSGPPSATSSERGSGDQEVTGTRQRAQSYVRKPVPAWDGNSVETEASVPAVPFLSPGMESVAFTTDIHVPDIPIMPASDLGSPTQSAMPLPIPNPAPAPPKRVDALSTAPTPPPVQPAQSPSPGVVVISERISSKASSPLRPKHPPLAPPTRSIPPSVFEHAHEMRKMLARATSADECRILVDMFLTRSKLVTDASELRALAATPPPQASGNTELEKTIVGLFLGDSEPDTQHQLRSPNRNNAEPADKQLETGNASPSISLPNGTTEVTDSH